MSKKPKDPVSKTAIIDDHADNEGLERPVQPTRPVAGSGQGAELFMRVFPCVERPAAPTPAETRSFAAGAVAGSDRVPAGFRRGRIWA
ncbi:hypothetical protein BH11PSE4_BH11PSE4_36250 [soil metagenome]